MSQVYKTKQLYIQQLIDLRSFWCTHHRHTVTLSLKNNTVQKGIFNHELFESFKPDVLLFIWLDKKLLKTNILHLYKKSILYIYVYSG